MPHTRWALDQALARAGGDSLFFRTIFRGPWFPLQCIESAVFCSRTEVAVSPTAGNNLHDFFGSRSGHRILRHKFQTPEYIRGPWRFVGFFANHALNAINTNWKAGKWCYALNRSKLFFGNDWR